MNAPAAFPRYADWLTTEQVGEQVGATSLVVNGWIVTGVKTDTGTIFLRAAKVGGRWRIEPAAVAEFVEATTAAALPKRATAAANGKEQPAPETAVDLKRRAASVRDRLIARGLSVPKPRTRRS
jgi:hypothetical protein